MIVSVHQPHFLPWPGYFNKVFNSDIFVWLHTVQYRKNYFQNRTKIKNAQGDIPFWLTIPVRASLETHIDQVEIVDRKWNGRIIKTIEQFYKKAPFFDEVWEPLKNELAVDSLSLDDVNFRTFCLLLKVLEYPGKVYRMEELGVDSEDANKRLRDICRKFESRDYIAGRGGRNYMREEDWLQEGITIHWQQLNPESLVYPQLGSSFLSGLSIIDCLFNVGVSETRRLVTSMWQVNS